MKRLKNWLKKRAEKKPVQSYIRPITGEVKVTRREFLMEQLEERIVLHAPGASDPIEFLGEEWYFVDIAGHGTPVGYGMKYSPCGDHNEIIMGTGGPDIIDCSGSDRRYIIVGYGGTDTIIGGEADDYIVGWDVAYYDSIENSFTGYLQSFYELISDRYGDGPVTGSNQRERLIGGGGTDYIWGGPCDDIIIGDSPDGVDSFRDHIYGNEGDDIIYGDREAGSGTAPDIIHGGPGNDTIYGDVRSGTGSGGDQIFGGDGNDELFGDTRSGTGSGRDEIWGGEGSDRIYGDSYYGDGYGRDELSGGPGDDFIYGDSVLGNGYSDDEIQGDDGNDTLFGDSSYGEGSGDDTILGDAGSDTVYGDSAEGTGSGDDRMSGGDGNDTIYGDSVIADGWGRDIISGGPGDDHLFGDTVSGTGSGNDVLDAGDGQNSLSGDGRVGSTPGHDSLYIHQGDTVSRAGIDGYIVVQVHQGPDGVSYEIVSNDGADYRIDEETGKLMVYNHVFARWDALGERYWDEEQQAYVQTSGGSVDVEYAMKHLRYENGGTQIWILRYGSWREYDPDSEYIVDMQEDWQTGALLVYNNDFERYEPFAEPFQPDGASYTVMNEFDMVSLMYNDGSMVYLENYGDGAFVSAEATGYSMLQMRGEKSYYDSTNGFWWSYGWDNWSFSIDGGSTWTEAPSLDIRVVEDPAGDSYVGIFDGREWNPVDGTLEFLDENFSQVGWLGMDQFFFDLYDGVGYDGEPLRLTVQEIYEFEGDPVMDRWGHWPAAGHEAADSSVPNGVLSKVLLNVYTQHTDKKVASFTVPNPADPIWRPAKLEAFGPLTVVFHANNAPSSAHKVQEWVRENVGVNVAYRSYDPHEYSLNALVEDLAALSQATKQPVRNLVILEHSGIVGSFGVGDDRITWADFIELGQYKYSRSLSKLNDIMVDVDGQIQYYGCDTAGARLDYDVDRALSHDPDPQDLLGWQSGMARRMLATMAQLTNTTVFASSDYNDVALAWYVWPPWPPQYDAEDWCLEFGVGPNGNQVDFKSLSRRPWLYAHFQELYDLNSGVGSFPGVAVSTRGEDPMGETWYYAPIKGTVVV